MSKREKILLVFAVALLTLAISPLVESGGVNWFPGIKITSSLGLDSVGVISSNTGVWAPEFDGGTMNLTGEIGVGGRATFGAAVWALEVDAGTIVAGDNGVDSSGVVKSQGDIRCDQAFQGRMLQLYESEIAWDFVGDDSFSIQPQSFGQGTLLTVRDGPLLASVGADGGYYSFAGGNVGINGTTIHGGEVWTPALDGGVVAATDVYASGSVRTDGIFYGPTGLSIIEGTVNATAGNFQGGLGTCSLLTQPGAYWCAGEALATWNQDAGYIDFLQSVHALGPVVFDGVATFGSDLDAGAVSAASLRLTATTGALGCNAGSDGKQVRRSVDGGTEWYVCGKTPMAGYQWHRVSVGLQRAVLAPNHGTSTVAGETFGGFRPGVPGHVLDVLAFHIQGGVGGGQAHWTVSQTWDGGLYNVCTAYSPCTTPSEPAKSDGTLTLCGAKPFSSVYQGGGMLRFGYDGGCTTVPEYNLWFNLDYSIDTLPVGD